jgi:hypothetical protein
MQLPRVDADYYSCSLLLIDSISAEKLGKICVVKSSAAELLFKEIYQ